MKTKTKKYNYQDTITKVQEIMLGRQMMEGDDEK